MAQVSRIAAWLSLLIPLSLLASLQVMQAHHPEWFCTLLNPGGKEMICGPDYGAPWVTTYRNIFFALWGLALAVAFPALLHRRLTKWPRIAWYISAVLAVALLALAAWSAAFWSNEDTP